MNDMRLFHQWWITLCLSIIWAFGATEADEIASPESGAGVVVSIHTPPSITNGIPVTLGIEFHNSTEEEKTVLKPRLDDRGCVNFYLQLFRMQPDASKEIQSRSIGLALANDRSDRIVLRGGGKTAFNISFAPWQYIDLGFAAEGRYKLVATFVLPDRSKVSNSTEFVLEALEAGQQKVVRAPLLRKITASQFSLVPERLPIVQHRVVLADNQEDSVSLTYDSADGFLTISPRLIYKGHRVQEFRVIHAVRPVESSEGIAHDLQLGLHYSVPDPMRPESESDPGAVQYGRVSFCHYVAVVYLVKNSLRVWSIGQYGPITGFEVGVGMSMPSESYARLLCDNAELAQNVTAVRDVIVEGGYLKISYSQGSGPDKTVLACERGLPKRDGGHPKETETGAGAKGPQ
jgi:hypothetical protein